MINNLHKLCISISVQSVYHQITCYLVWENLCSYYWLSTENLTALYIRNSFSSVSGPYGVSVHSVQLIHIFKSNLQSSVPLPVLNLTEDGPFRLKLATRTHTCTHTLKLSFSLTLNRLIPLWNSLSQ